MKHIFRSLYIVTIIGLFAPILSSCSNDEEETFNEWDATYVSLQRNDYLSGTIKKFNLTHYPNEMGGDEVKMVFTVKTQKPATTDIIVDLSAKSETKGLDANQIKLSDSQVVIKAGKMCSEEITATIDPAIFSEIKEKTSFSFSIFINNITSQNKNTVISRNLSTLPVQINKSAYSNLKNGVPGDGSRLINNRLDWIVKAQEGVLGTGNALIDGDAETDIARLNERFWFTVDLAEIKTVTGIATDHYWGDMYAPREVEIFWSEDGNTWQSMSSLAVSTNYQGITFITPVKTRYLKYQIITIAPATYTSITEFYVFESTDQ